MRCRSGLEHGRVPELSGNVAPRATGGDQFLTSFRRSPLVVRWMLVRRRERITAAKSIPSADSLLLAAGSIRSSGAVPRNASTSRLSMRLAQDRFPVRTPAHLGIAERRITRRSGSGSAHAIRSLGLLTATEEFVLANQLAYLVLLIEQQAS